MSVIGSNILAGASGQAGYNLTKSLRFRSSASAYLNRTPATASNRQIWTWSGWVKRGGLSSGSYMDLFTANLDGNSFTELRYHFNVNDDTLVFTDVVAGNSYAVYSSNVYRDASAWYHIVCSVDTTQATNTNRVKLYVNGVQVTQNAGGSGYPLQNANTQVNATVVHWHGGLSGIGRYFDGYLAEVNFIDGQALTPSSFGQTSTSTGVWIPKKYTGTYGTNGFYLPFTDTASTSTLGTDFSGNSNTWTVNNISLTSGSTYDSMNDVPTLTSATTANYATLNPLIVSSYQTLSNGNLTSKSNTSADNGAAYGTIPTGTSGKWYIEFTADTSGGGGYPVIGTLLDTTNLGNANGATGIPGASGTGSCGYQSNGNKYIAGIGSAYGSSWVTGDVIGVAIDATNGAIYFSKNNTWQNSGVPTSGASKTGAANTWTGSSTSSFYVGLASYISGSGANVNFGQQSFSYTPPTGFVALNTFNLPTPTIGATASTTANKYFDATLYTGNGGTQSIVNAGGFQPDFVWEKARSDAFSHMLYNSLSGTGKYLRSNLTSAEVTDATTLTSFNSNGFTVGAGDNGNNSGTTAVAWQWRGGGTGVSNTAGSITSTVSANTTAGFSIATYTNQSSGVQTVGHGLGVAPKMIVVKFRSTTSNWFVYHQSIGNTGGVFFDTTTGTITNSAYWNNTSPTSSVFTLGTIWNSTATAVAYCFSEVAGYSAFGSYTGNGSSDGTFVFTNFQPAFVMVKRTDTTGNWFIVDNKRLGYNGGTKNLYPNLSNAEATLELDLISNGFKWRLSGADVNASGGTYIYMAVASNPFKYSLGA